ncbi:MAG: hypothetical protein JSS09_08490 [Verrucomicrobia bacterium]|nr:hypothetical protein [Verrucomicrobiota bacterium]
MNRISSRFLGCAVQGVLQGGKNSSALQNIQPKLFTPGSFSGKPFSERSLLVGTTYTGQSKGPSVAFPVLTAAMLVALQTAHADCEEGSKASDSLSKVKILLREGKYFKAFEVAKNMDGSKKNEALECITKQVIQESYSGGGLRFALKAIALIDDQAKQDKLLARVKDEYVLLRKLCFWFSPESWGLGKDLMDEIIDAEKLKESLKEILLQEPSEERDELLVQFTTKYIDAFEADRVILLPSENILINLLTDDAKDKCLHMSATFLLKHNDKSAFEVIAKTSEKFKASETYEKFLIALTEKGGAKEAVSLAFELKLPQQARVLQSLKEAKYEDFALALVQSAPRAEKDGYLLDCIDKELKLYKENLLIMNKKDVSEQEFKKCAENNNDVIGRLLPLVIGLSISKENDTIIQSLIKEIKQVDIMKEFSGAAVINAFSKGTLLFSLVQKLPAGPIKDQLIEEGIDKIVAVEIDVIISSQKTFGSSLIEAFDMKKPVTIKEKLEFAAFMNFFSAIPGKIQFYSEFLKNNPLIDDYTLGVIALKEAKILSTGPEKDTILLKIKDKYFSGDNRKSLEIVKGMSSSLAKEKALKQVVDSFLKIGDKETALEAVHLMMSGSQKDQYLKLFATELLDGVEAFSVAQEIGSLQLQQQVLAKIFPGIDL